MSKQQLIDTILEHTRGIPADFLETFDDQTLRSYLKRLTTLRGERGRGSGWVREGGSPAIASRADFA
jgi:hypothetical protein